MRLRRKSTANSLAGGEQAPCPPSLRARGQPPQSSPACAVHPAQLAPSGRSQPGPLRGRGRARLNPGMPELATIGVYEFDQESFLAALRSAGIRLLIDVRQRRGVRGAQYAWANEGQLRLALHRAQVSYLHRRDLAPTTELRRLQYDADDRAGVGKRSRVELAGAYVERYTREILDHADLESLQRELLARGPGALLCVERDPAACHRSLLAARMQQRFGFAVRHLTP
ncbi:MAG: hypothetical protein NVS1B9_03550 [Solirubrobacteraceae bacterium]